MRTLIIALCFACLCTNALLLSDWIVRGETVHAIGAGGMCALCGTVACLVRRLRF